MKLAFNIAKRFLFSAKKQTIVIILGIAVGVSVQVFIGALINGLQANLIDTAIGSQSQITLSNKQNESFIDDYQTILTTLEDNNQLTYITPSITSSGRLSYETNNESIILKGVDFEKAEGIYNFKEKLSLDSSNIPDAVNEVALGIGLKDLLNVEIGDTINYIDNSRPSDPPISLTIVGFINFNILNLDNSWVVSTLATTQQILNVNSNQTQSIEMQLDDPFEAEVVSSNIVNEIDNPSIASMTWIERNQDLLSGLQGQSISSLMIQIFVIISVVLGISSVLAITVLQKSRQLGILKAMGIKDRDASKIFLFEGLMLGFFGAIIGIALGIGLLYAFDLFADTGIPITIDIGFLALSATIAITASTIAALSPALKSSKLSVIEVIRNG